MCGLRLSFPKSGNSHTDWYTFVYTRPHFEIQPARSSLFHQTNFYTELNIWGVCTVHKLYMRRMEQVNLVTIPGTTMLVPNHIFKWLLLIQRWGACRFHSLAPHFQLSCSDLDRVIGCQNGGSSNGWLINMPHTQKKTQHNHPNLIPLFIQRLLGLAGTGNFLNSNS